MTRKAPPAKPPRLTSFANSTAGRQIAANVYYAMLRGWKDAAACHEMRTEFSEHEDESLRKAYENSFEEGTRARHSFAQYAQIVSGHTPCVLRGVTK
jgi:hypothetical protein